MALRQYIVVSDKNFAFTNASAAFSSPQYRRQLLIFWTPHRSKTRSMTTAAFASWSIF
jgi:hypothetical protein